MADSTPEKSPDFSRREFLKKTAAAAAWGLAASHGGTRAFASPGATAPAKTKPNLLFVFSDQQSWDMLGCYGNSQIITPNLDAFAKQSVQFNNCFSNAPVCSPWRGCLMTGQHPLNHGVIRNDHQLIDDPGTRLGHVLKDAGYKTGYIGKWHLLGGYRAPHRPIPAGPERHGFDHVFLSNNCDLDFRPANAFYYDQKSGEKIRFNEWEHVGQTNQALEFIEGCNHEEPFALVLSWHPPHNHAGMHYYAPKELEDMYPKEKIQVRPDATDQASATLLAEYQGHMAMITGIDRCFGQLMAKLKQKGLDENTIVVFTSDHGDMMRYVPGGKHGNEKARLFKSMAQPTSSHTPLLVRYPKQLRPRESSLLIGGLDLMPTLLGLLQLPIPKTAQGRDLSQAITTENDRAVESLPLFIFPGRGWRGVVTRDHVYACEINDDDAQKGTRFQLLIDRRKDPYAMNDLFGQAAHRDLQGELHRATLKHMAGFGDEGWSYNDLVEATLEDPRELKAPFAAKALMKNKGRPLDMIRQAKVRGKFAKEIEALA